MTETPDESPEKASDQKPDTASEPTRPRSATSRARRIGGAASEAAQPTRPTPKPRDEGTAAAKTGSTTKDAGSPVSVSKGRSAKPDKSAKARRPDKAASTRTEGRAGGLQVSLPGWAVWAPAVTFAAVAVVFLTLFLVARIGGDDSDATSGQTRERVVAAAKTCLGSLNTYRYDQLDAAEAAGIKCTTGKLQSDFRRTMTTIIRKNAPTLRAVQQAKINTAGIESVTKNGKQWSVLAYGQLTLTTTNIKQGRLDPFSVVARLEQVNGQWVLSKIDTVSSAT